MYTLADLFRFSENSADLFRVSCFDRNLAIKRWRRQNVLDEFKISMSSYMHGHNDKKGGEVARLPHSQCMHALADNKGEILLAIIHFLSYADSPST